MSKRPSTARWLISRRSLPWRYTGLYGQIPNNNDRIPMNCVAFLTEIIEKTPPKRQAKGDKLQFSPAESNTSWISELDRPSRTVPNGHHPDQDLFRTPNTHQLSHFDSSRRLCSSSAVKALGASSPFFVPQENSHFDIRLSPVSMASQPTQIHSVPSKSTYRRPKTWLDFGPTVTSNLPWMR